MRVEKLYREMDYAETYVYKKADGSCGFVVGGEEIPLEVIRAAPELLEATKLAKSRIALNSDMDDLYDVLKAVISKAEDDHKVKGVSKKNDFPRK